DFPLVVVAHRDDDPQLLWSLLTALGPVSNTCILPAPVAPWALVSAVQAALRARRRQYELRALNETLEQRIAERAGLITLLHDVASAANGARDLEGALAFALRRICDHYDCAFAQALFPADDDPDVLVPGPVFHAQEPARFESFRAATRSAAIRRGQDLAGRVFADGRPRATQDIAADLRPARAAAAAALGIAAGLAVPVLVGDEVVAVLEFHFGRPVEADKRLLDALSSVGAQLGRIIERQRAELILRRNERLASMGNFAAGIAHELNNPLSSILMTARYALKKEQDRAALNGLLQEIIEDAERCARTVRDVLRFAKEEPGERAPLVISEVVQRVVNLVRRTADQQGVRLEADTEPAAPAIQANPAQIEQAIASVVMNAVQASAPGQSVLVRTRSTPGRLHVIVRDHGRGMTSQERQRAFDPFYTGRSREGRAGLGLTMAHGVVADHGGRIEIESQPDQGTTVRIELPVNPGPGVTR
ncbi:MAG: ATP-binding protein, partial [Planctomycetota bacterium]